METPQTIAQHGNTAETCFHLISLENIQTQVVLLLLLLMIMIKKIRRRAETVQTSSLREVGGSRENVTEVLMRLVATQSPAISTFREHANANTTKGIPESVLENWTYKILWNFVIQTDHPIKTRKLD